MSTASQEAPPVDRIEQAERFRALHEGPEPLLIPNAWDAGSAKLLVSLGFRAVATTSSGFAASLGRLDGTALNDEALANAAVIVNAVGVVPVSADLENGLGDEPSTVRMTMLNALSVGLSGCSIEDYTGRPDDPIYEAKFAAERDQSIGQVLPVVPGTNGNRNRTLNRERGTERRTGNTNTEPRTENRERQDHKRTTGSQAYGSHTRSREARGQG